MINKKCVLRVIERSEEIRPGRDMPDHKYI